jgi:hypothetical protein
MAASPQQQTEQFIETASRAELQRILRVLVERSIEAAVLAYQQIPAPGTYQTHEPPPSPAMRCIHPGVFATERETEYCSTCGREVPRAEL